MMTEQDYRAEGDCTSCGSELREDGCDCCTSCGAPPDKDCDPRCDREDDAPSMGHDDF